MADDEEAGTQEQHPTIVPFKFENFCCIRESSTEKVYRCILSIILIVFLRIYTRTSHAGIVYKIYASQYF